MDADATRSTTPFRIRLGVTGHRSLTHDQVLMKLVREILSVRYLEALDEEARQAIHSNESIPVCFSIVSPLAEGADRLVAKVVMEFPDSRLEAVVPSSLDDYTSHFTSPESREEFASLLNRAHRCIRLENSVAGAADGYRYAEPDRNGFYEIGEYVIDHCDILLALWDEKPAKGKGGTADIISLAVKKGVPVFIISTDRPGRVTLINGQSLSLSSLNRLPESSL